MQNLLFYTRLFFPIRADSFSDAYLELQEELHEKAQSQTLFAALQADEKCSPVTQLLILFIPSICLGLLLTTTYTLVSLMYSGSFLPWTWLVTRVGPPVLMINAIPQPSDRVISYKISQIKKILHKVVLVGTLISQVAHAIIFPNPLWITSALLTPTLCLLQTYNVTHLTKYVRSFPQKTQIVLFCYMTKLKKHPEHPEGLKKIRNFFAFNSISSISITILALWTHVYSPSPFSLVSGAFQSYHTYSNLKKTIEACKEITASEKSSSLETPETCKETTASEKSSSLETPETCKEITASEKSSSLETPETCREITASEKSSSLETPKEFSAI